MLAFDGLRIAVQGITGHQGRFHARSMLTFGSQVVAGISPSGIGSEVEGVPVYGSVMEAKVHTGANCSVLFVPAAQCKDAALEAMDAGIKLLVIVTEHLPLHDTMTICQYARTMGVGVIGPNSPGMAIPGKVKMGIMPNDIFLEGNVAVVSRSGTLTYEVVQSLTDQGIGQSFCVGVGGDPIVGTSLLQMISQLEKDPKTHAIVLIGEIGGGAEQKVAEALGKNIKKPLVSFVAGRTAPAGKRMGHAGAIISGQQGTYDAKRAMLEEAGSVVCDRLEDIPVRVKEIIDSA